MTDIRYVTDPDTLLKRTRGARSGRKMLLGARLHVDTSDNVGGWIPARTVPNAAGKSHRGFVLANNLSDRQQLKVFYVDVGQGDATLIEADGAIVIIDGGPNRGFYNRLRQRLAALRRADADAGLAQRTRLHINAVVVSHFDKDHYQGLTRVLNDDDFEFGVLYHNGLPRYDETARRDLDLGTLTGPANGPRSISTDLRDLASARQLLQSGNLMTANGNLNTFGKFLDAAVRAANAGRLQAMQLLVRRDTATAANLLPGTGPGLRFEVLAPVTTSSTGAIRLPAFPDPHKVCNSNPHPTPSASHTINGNSVVLRLTHGTNTFLFGGDLNQPSQKHLAAAYGGLAAFRADVNKACHHGSSDFDLGYLQAVSPHATVFSSGDSGTYDHPMPDAMGAAAKSSSGAFPLVFSTELARESGSSGVKLGHINARSNGTTIVMAQKKEKPSATGDWHSFPLPYPGPFGH